MQDLIAKLEAAPEGSALLDFEVWCALHGHVSHAYIARRCPTYRYQPKGCDHITAAADPPPEYTTSLDAALTLVPEGYWWGVNYSHYITGEKWIGRASVTPPNQTSGVIPRQGNTPALALCIAALKAREAQS